MTVPLVVLNLTAGDSQSVSEGCGQGMGNFCKSPGCSMFSQSWEALHKYLINRTVRHFLWPRSTKRSSHKGQGEQRKSGEFWPRQI